MWSRCDENADGSVDFQEFLSKLVRRKYKFVGFFCNFHEAAAQLAAVIGMMLASMF